MTQPGHLLEQHNSTLLQPTILQQGSLWVWSVLMVNVIAFQVY